jgi:acetylornithine deacetylase/succinyl-diaminopimelate desuccinylase-like protein
MRARRAPNAALLAVRASASRSGEFREALAELVAVPGSSGEGAAPPALERSAEATAAVLRRLGLENVAVLRVPRVAPAVYGEWLGKGSDAPTALVYGHHDVAPPGRAEQWSSPPFQPTERAGRLFGRGAASKAAFVSWAAAASALLQAGGGAPVNLRFLVEGEGESGSPGLPFLIARHRDRLAADVLLASGAHSTASGAPALATGLGGLAEVELEVTCLGRPVHSGDFGGAVPDAVRILCRLIDDVAAGRELAVTAIEAHPLHGAANQILDAARARLSLRTAPDADVERATGDLVWRLTTSPPAGAGVEVRVTRSTPGWVGERSGAVVGAARRALARGYGATAALVRAGAPLGGVSAFARALGVPCLVTGIETPEAGLRAHDESLHLGGFGKAIRAAVHLYHELGGLGRARLVAGRSDRSGPPNGGAAGPGRGGRLPIRPGERFDPRGAGARS